MASPSRRPMLQIANVCGTSSLYLARMDTSAPSKGPPGSRNASSMGTRHISLMPLWRQKSALAFSGKSSTATVGVSWVFRFPSSLLVGFRPLLEFCRRQSFRMLLNVPIPSYLHPLHTLLLASKPEYNRWRKPRDNRCWRPADSRCYYARNEMGARNVSGVIERSA